MECRAPANWPSNGNVECLSERHGAYTKLARSLVILRTVTACGTIETDDCFDAKSDDEVASTLGYCSTGMFSVKLFEKLTGMTTNEYRN